MTQAKGVAVALMLALAAGAAWAGAAGDAVFAERGPWTLGDEALRWDVHVEGPQAEGFLPITAGAVTISEGIDPSDQKPVLYLTVNTDTRERRIGPFPVSGGDPALTYFLEQVTRDMATLAGGSPFYIRNRIKDAVFRGGEIAASGEERVATFRPFADDPNAARMGGFETLTLTFALDHDPKAPIREMRAETQGGVGGSPVHYRQQLVRK